MAFVLRTTGEDALRTERPRWRLDVKSCRCRHGTMQDLDITANARKWLYVEGIA